MALTGQNESGRITLEASEAIGKNILVKISSGKAAISGASEAPIGVTRNVVASGDLVAVELLSKQGTLEGVAAAAITEGATIYAKAAGKIDDADAGSDVKIGVALAAATNAGDIVPFLPSLQL